MTVGAHRLAASTTVTSADLVVRQRLPWPGLLFLLANSAFLVWLGVTDSHSWYRLLGEEVSVGSIALGGASLAFWVFAALRILVRPMLVIDRKTRSLTSYRSWVVEVVGLRPTPVDLPCSLAGGAMEIRQKTVVITAHEPVPVKVVIRREALSSDSLEKLTSFFAASETAPSTSPTDAESAPRSDG